MAGDVATGVVVASHHLKSLVLGKEFHALVDIATVWILAVGACLHIVGHITIVEEMVNGLVVKALEQGLQHSGTVVHVAGNEDVMLTPVGVNGLEINPVGGEIVGRGQCGGDTIGVHVGYPTPAHTI